MKVGMYISINNKKEPQHETVHYDDKKANSNCLKRAKVVFWGRATQ
jgi:hypothetical protein